MEEINPEVIAIQKKQNSLLATVADALEVTFHRKARKPGKRIKLPFGWRMSKFPGGQPDVMTRQRKRAECRSIAWHKWRCFKGPMGEIDQAPRDDRGVISRRQRRSIAMQIARDAFRVMGRPGTNVQRG